MLEIALRKLFISAVFTEIDRAHHAFESMANDSFVKFAVLTTLTAKRMFECPSSLLVIT